MDQHPWDSTAPLLPVCRARCPLLGSTAALQGTPAGHTAFPAVVRLPSSPCNVILLSDRSRKHLQQLIYWQGLILTCRD